MKFSSGQKDKSKELTVRGGEKKSLEEELYFMVK